MKKQFLTYEEQLKKLMIEKQLVIEDLTYAKKKLEQISYYSLIGGYKELFKHKPSGRFLRGVSFTEIVQFYYFDEALRSLFLKYILHIERHIKSLISYYFCEKYGSDQNTYLSIVNFNSSPVHQKEVKRLIASLDKIVRFPTHYNYIAHHITAYGNVPLWVAMNAFTFGQTSAFYQYIGNDLQTKVSKQFPIDSEKQLHQFITILAKCRNVCAHGERLYNFKTSDAISDTTLHRKLSIERKNGQYVFGKNDLFAVIISLYYLLEYKEFAEFKYKLEKLIEKVNTQCPHILPHQLLREMGFPENWGFMGKFKRI